jgi:hypothetical protein
MLEPSPILVPVISLVSWTMVMWSWMYVTRIPAIQKAKMVLNPQAPRGEQMSTLPPSVRWKADNYNHLFEHPTIFYALALSLAMLGEGSGTNLMLAWAYVGLRVAHSVFQATVNKIEVRFVLFFLSSLLLLPMLYNVWRILL